MKLPTQMFHLAEEENWPSIKRYGLLSAEKLMLRSNTSHLLNSYRMERTVLSDGTIIRDQKPIPPKALERCLIGMHPAEWYRLLNSKIFFWFDPDRVNRQKKACGANRQKVMIIGTEHLLSKYAEAASVTPFNTGNARRKPAPRSRDTFVPYTAWLKSAWKTEAEGLGKHSRPRSHKPVELTLNDSVPDIMDFVIDVKSLNENAFL